jgi:endonuclease/exonuclease/phosphatase family metal-dependent hydrolase
MKLFKKMLKILLIVISIFVIGFIGLIVYAVFSDYKPDEKVVVFSSENPDKINDTLELSLLTWNIGYCGLDKEMDFFYDGGTKVRTPELKCIDNLHEVQRFLKQNDSIDFILIQELDKRSKRSYYINEFDSLSKVMVRYHSFFAKNYDVFFVPVPPADPMGKVLSGITIFSKYQPSSSVRYSFPGKYGFPKQLFMLDRCFLVNRYPLENGKELVIINTHNEAFDPGEIRKAQMMYLKSFLLDEYQKGNFIIAGGDWNQSPPDFKPDFAVNKINELQMMMTSDYLTSDWKWVYDNKSPSNRSVITAYEATTTTTTVIDLFLLSPNVESLKVECINLNFENSDHNPVRVSVKLLK